ncbi:MAG: VOC family protein [Candidatus Zixiibacteriota bacterium]
MANETPKQGTFCWNELMTRDLAAAKKFYSELIGWKIVDSGMPGMEYNMLKAGETNAGGMMAMPSEVPDQIPSHWMAYITVDDVDAAAKKVVKLGGQILHGPMDIPTVGRFMTIADPTGAAIALITFPKQ